VLGPIQLEVLMLLVPYTWQGNWTHRPS